MAYLYGRTPDWIANHQAVQDELDKRSFEIAVRAEQILVEHRMDGDAEIDVVHGDVDYYVVMSDERGQDAALSIEYGRAAGSKVVKDKRTGEEKTVTWGDMEGLYVLATASNLPKKRKGKVKVD
jgi:hypothetical protein